VASNRQVTTYSVTVLWWRFRGIHEPVAGLLRGRRGVVYLNGTEVFRSNLPLGPLTT
jgi:hypothetical protein